MLAKNFRFQKSLFGGIFSRCFFVCFCFVFFMGDDNHFSLTREKKYVMHREVIRIRNQYLKCKFRLSCFEFLKTINTSLENF